MEVNTFYCMLEKRKVADSPQHVSTTAVLFRPKTLNYFLLTKYHQ